MQKLLENSAVASPPMPSDFLGSEVWQEIVSEFRAADAGDDDQMQALYAQAIELIAGNIESPNLSRAMAQLEELMTELTSTAVTAA